MMQEKEKNKPSWLQMRLSVILCSQMLHVWFHTLKQHLQPDKAASYNMNYQ